MKRRLLFFTVLPWILTGCLYIHHDAKQKLAEEARTEFKTAASQSTAVTAGIDLRSRHQLLQSLTSEFHRADETILLGALLDKTWSGLAAESSELLQLNRTEIENSIAEQRGLEARLKEQLAALPGVHTNVTNLLEALNQAAKSAARYEATQTLLKESLLTLVDDTRTNGWSNLTNLLGESRTFPIYTIDPDGSLKEEQGTNKVSELLEVDPSLFGVKCPKTPKDLEALKPVLVKLSGGAGGGLTFTHPGIATTLIGLAYDLSQVEEKRIREEIAFAKSCLSLHKQAVDARSALTNALELEMRSSDDGGDGIVAIASTLAASSNETTRATLDGIVLKYQRATAAAIRAASNADADEQRLLAQTQREYLALAYRSLARHHSLRMKEHDIASIENQIEMLNSEHALQSAATNIQEREAVIRRGLEGLVAFHNGGVNQEDLARIIGLAQTAGIFWIGAK